MGHGVHMKCSESTTILCTCTATSKMHACNKCVQISSAQIILSCSAWQYCTDTIWRFNCPFVIRWLWFNYYRGRGLWCTSNKFSLSTFFRMLIEWFPRQRKKKHASISIPVDTCLQVGLTRFSNPTVSRPRKYLEYIGVKYFARYHLER